MTTLDQTPAHHRLVQCADCASTVHTIHHPGKVMSVQVEHSSTCPYWRGEQLFEVALVFLPEPTS